MIRERIADESDRGPMSLPCVTASSMKRLDILAGALICRRKWVAEPCGQKNYSNCHVAKAYCLTRHSSSNLCRPLERRPWLDLGEERASRSELLPQCGRSRSNPGGNRASGEWIGSNVKRGSMGLENCRVEAAGSRTSNGSMPGRDLGPRALRRSTACWVYPHASPQSNRLGVAQRPFGSARSAGTAEAPPQDVPRGTVSDRSRRRRRRRTRPVER